MVGGGGRGDFLSIGWRVSRRPAPDRRLSWNSIRWQIGRLEAVDRHRVGFVADLKLESERRTAKHSVGASIGGS